MNCIVYNIPCKLKLNLMSVFCSGLILLFTVGKCNALQSWTFEPAKPDKTYSARNKSAENASYGGPPGSTFFIGKLHYRSSGAGILSESVRYPSDDMIANEVAKYGGDYYTKTAEGNIQEEDQFVRNFFGKTERKRSKSITETFKVYRKLSYIEKPTKSVKISKAETYLRKGRDNVISAEEAYLLGLSVEKTKSTKITWYKVAINNFTNAIKTDPELGVAYGDRGEAYYAMWKLNKDPVLLEKSEADLEKAIELVKDKTMKGVYVEGLNYLRHDKRINKSVTKP